MQNSRYRVLYFFSTSSSERSYLCNIYVRGDAT